MVDDNDSIYEQDQDKLQNTKTKQFLIAIKVGTEIKLGCEALSEIKKF